MSLCRDIEELVGAADPAPQLASLVPGDKALPAAAAPGDTALLAASHPGAHARCGALPGEKALLAAAEAPLLPLPAAHPWLRGVRR
mmetsp:Transcript_85753/g.183804  ORF Transcript_85753/g.183804 Transcript_85753/m.183804 type:complete len:86 (-) Transcript_85753:1110-1367(-)